VIVARVVLVALAAALAVAAGAAGAAQAADKPVRFQLPSHQIACWSDRTFVRCDILDPEHKPKRPASCELDYGHAFELTRTGRGHRICAGDTVLDPKAPVLRYGKSKRFGSFTCRSRRSGLRCTNRRGHGFELSRARQRLF
jgi:hypothetical protein